MTSISSCYFLKLPYFPIDISIYFPFITTRIFPLNIIRVEVGLTIILLISSGVAGFFLFRKRRMWEATRRRKRKTGTRVRRRRSSSCYEFSRTKWSGLFSFSCFPFSLGRDYMLHLRGLGDWILRVCQNGLGKTENKDSPRLTIRDGKTSKLC